MVIFGGYNVLRRTWVEMEKLLSFEKSRLNNAEAAEENRFEKCGIQIRKDNNGNVSNATFKAHEHLTLSNMFFRIKLHLLLYYFRNSRSLKSLLN